MNDFVIAICFVFMLLVIQAVFVKYRFRLLRLVARKPARMTREGVSIVSKMHDADGWYFDRGGICKDFLGVSPDGTVFLFGPAPSWRHRIVYVSLSETDKSVIRQKYTEVKTVLLSDGQKRIREVLMS